MYESLLWSLFGLWLNYECGYLFAKRAKRVNYWFSCKCKFTSFLVDLVTGKILSSLKSGFVQDMNL